MIEFMIDEADIVTHVTLNHNRYEEGNEIRKFFEAIGIKITMYEVITPSRKGRDEIIRAARYLNEYHEHIDRFKKKGWVS